MRVEYELGVCVYVVLSYLRWCVCSQAWAGWGAAHAYLYVQSSAFPFGLLGLECMSGSPPPFLVDGPLRLLLFSPPWSEPFPPLVLVGYREKHREPVSLSLAGKLLMLYDLASCLV